ncbi:MAG: phosphomannomutase [Thermodesulfobacteriota bacterium]|nr:phosphomannomutase [Thermodesulfobacteriota bacterium]
MSSLDCFKAYDIRGKVPDDLDEDLAYRIGQAFTAQFSPKKIAIGHDIRLSGPGLSQALAKGFMDAGVDVIDLGLCGTEEIYFASFHLDVDGGIIVTASHNPAEYNGMKFVRKGAVPVSGDTGLKEIEKLAAQGKTVKAEQSGNLSSYNIKTDYMGHLIDYVDITALSPLKIVVNSGNGCAGLIIDLLETFLPFTFIRLQHEPDGTFPNGVPNPLLPENREITAQAVRENQADLGIAWDGDFDRCFFFDENGGFIEGYYIVGLLAQIMLKKSQGAKIIHDPRLIWNTRELVELSGGTPVLCKTGHAFIKERMRAEDAVYGGEMSAHHYFRDFSYCDSGMIPWLLIAEMLCHSKQKMSTFVKDMMAAYPVSGEINNRVSDPDAVMSRIESAFAEGCLEKDFTDGLSMSFADYRFNVRKSNTEPVLRLNVETRANPSLLQEKTDLLLEMINT